MTCPANETTREQRKVPTTVSVTASSSQTTMLSIRFSCKRKQRSRHKNQNEAQKRAEKRNVYEEEGPENEAENEARMKQREKRETGRNSEKLLPSQKQRKRREKKKGDEEERFTCSLSLFSTKEDMKRGKRERETSSRFSLSSFSLFSKTRSASSCILFLSLLSPPSSLPGISLVSSTAFILSLSRDHHSLQPDKEIRTHLDCLFPVSPSSSQDPSISLRFCSFSGTYSARSSRRREREIRRDREVRQEKREETREKRQNNAFAAEVKLTGRRGVVSLFLSLLILNRISVSFGPEIEEQGCQIHREPVYRSL